MSSANGRTPAQIRAEIKAERAKLDAALAAFRDDAKRTGRIGGSALGGMASLLFVARLMSRRRRSG